MKEVLAAVALFAFGAFHFDSATASVAGISQVTATAFASSPQAAGRKGSKRVGGKNSKGKGSKYVGGKGSKK